MAIDRIRKVDQLAAWAEATGNAMSGVSGNPEPIGNAFPSVAAHLQELALRTLEEAMGEKLDPATPLVLLYRPGRLRLCVGQESLETEVSGDVSSLEEAVIGASQALAVARTEY